MSAIETNGAASEIPLARALAARSAAEKTPFYRKLYLQVLIAVALGATLGYVYPEFAISLKPYGDAFVRAIRVVVAPIIFTTTVMHLVEFLIFFAALLLPAFVIPVHAAVYLALVGYTYLIGMIDHAGVRLTVPLPLHADNRFHDDHHVCFHCNYGHHTALFDKLHGTVKRADRQYGEDVFH